MKEKQTKEAPLLVRWVIGGPLLWLMFIPVVGSDFVLEIFHQIFFRLHGMKTIQRSRYIKIFDRAKLPYLTWVEKINCAYCGYVNGWLHYAATIAARVEQYYCAITHLEDRGYIPSEHEKDFAKYGDESAFRKRYGQTD